MDGDENTEEPVTDEEATDDAVDGDENIEESDVEEDATDEVTNEQQAVWDRLVGYYHQLTTAYATFVSLLKF